MKIIQTSGLWILIFLAVSSGVTKVLLMPQDVEFFGKYGITGYGLVAFGAAQLCGGLMMSAMGTRTMGAAVVAVSFLISAGLLIMEGNLPVTLITLIAVAALIWIVWRTRTDQKRMKTLSED